MNLKNLAAVVLTLGLISSLSVLPCSADTKAQQQKTDAASAQAKSDAQAAAGHPLRASRQAKKAEESTQNANQQTAKNATCATRMGKSKNESSGRKRRR